MEVTKDSMIGQLVSTNYRIASVFKSYGIDFCCNGNRSIGDACEQSTANLDELINDIQQVVNSKEGIKETNYQDWDMDLLVDYIEKKHHRYVTKKIPEINAHLQKIASVHGERHPELIEINQLFATSAEALLSHMKKEEHILFPYVRQQVEADNENSANPKPHFGTVQNPIHVMMEEHDTEGERFRKIATLSNNYTPPTDACGTYEVAYAMLKEFEEDLHLHIHLENNILFPKSMEMEQNQMNAKAH